MNSISGKEKRAKKWKDKKHNISYLVILGVPILQGSPSQKASHLEGR